MSLDPKTNTLAVTGGEDDKAFVWRLSDGELLFECAGERLGRSGSLDILAGGPCESPAAVVASVLCWIQEPTTE